MLTCTCSIASSEIGATPVRSPGWPPRPNELLKAAPLIVMLFMRLSAPPNELAPEVCGVRRVKSLIRPWTVGSVASVSRLTEVAAPVRAELNTALDSAVTVTVSVTAIGLTLMLRSVATPRLISTFSTVSGANAAVPGAGVRDGDGVRTADAHVDDDEPAIRARRGFVGRARRKVDRDDARAGHPFLRFVLNFAVK